MVPQLGARWVDGAIDVRVRCAIGAALAHCCGRDDARLLQQPAWPCRPEQEDTWPCVAMRGWQLVRM
jgi:hypothetical protein